MTQRTSRTGSALPRSLRRPTRRHLLKLIATGTVLLPLRSLQSDVALAASGSDLFSSPPPTSQIAIDHGVWDQLLRKYVVEERDGINRIDYRRFKTETHGQLKTYIANLQKTDVRRLNRADQFALLANLYNAKTVDIVLTAYPVKSIRDISLGGGLTAVLTGGPWKAKVVSLGGVELSLDDIEHDILRRVFGDPRVHYAVNCASLGCPNLQRTAFTGDRLDAQLDSAARAFINNRRAFAIDGDKVVASSIYSWFQSDFGTGDVGVLRHAARYAEPALAARLSKAGAIAGYQYDWQLNDIAR